MGNQLEKEADLTIGHQAEEQNGLEKRPEVAEIEDLENVGDEAEGACAGLLCKQ